MICKRCGHESPETTPVCPSCRTRLIPREWTVSAWLLGVTAGCLVLLGAGGAWIAVEHHPSPAIPVPEAAIIPGAAKPSPAIPVTSEPQVQPPSDVFRHFAPPRTPSPATPPVAPVKPVPPPPAPRASSPTSTKPTPAPVSLTPPWTPTARPGPTPVSVTSRPAAAVTYPLGSVRNEIQANSRVIKHFTVPSGLAVAHYQTDVVRLDGSRRLHVWVVKDNRTFFDSGVCSESHINMDLPSGNYLLVVANAALLFPVTVDIRGQITGTRQ